MGITSQKIAELAGVSRGTGDRALNHRGGVKPQVQRRIEELARQHGYSPNRAGKALVTRDGNKNVLLGAIRSVTGRNHRIGVKRSSGAPAAGSSAGQAPPPEDPLAAFLQNSRAQGLDVLDQLSQVTGEPVPAPLAALRSKESRFRQTVEKEHMVDAVLGMLE